MSPETLKMVREALETIADYADPQPRFTDADDAGQACYEIGKVASRAIAALEAATPAGPSEREAFQCPSCGAAIKAPAPTDKESK